MRSWRHGSKLRCVSICQFGTSSPSRSRVRSCPRGPVRRPVGAGRFDVQKRRMGGGGRHSPQVPNCWHRIDRVGDHVGAEAESVDRHRHEGQTARVLGRANAQGAAAEGGFDGVHTKVDGAGSPRQRPSDRGLADPGTTRKSGQERHTRDIAWWARRRDGEADQTLEGAVIARLRDSRHGVFRLFRAAVAPPKGAPKRTGSAAARRRCRGQSGCPYC